jgi:polyisoprenoid-binding protein YceI
MQRGLLFVGLLLTGVATSASQTVWRVDKSHSSMMFTVRHMLVSEVPGYFKEWDMKITASKDDWTDATVEAVAKTASINTDNERRDADLRSDNFFNSERFPEMKFVSTAFEKVGDKKYKIKGNLTIRDVTKEVVFDAELLGMINDPRVGTRVGWKATAQINRFDFGLKWNRMMETGGLVVGETVNITILLELIKQAA